MTGADVKQQQRYVNHMATWTEGVAQSLREAAKAADAALASCVVLTREEAGLIGRLLVGLEALGNVPTDVSAQWRVLLSPDEAGDE